VETFLVPEKTVVEAKGEGPVVELSAAAGKVLLVTLVITRIVEQQSLDVSVWGSADGNAWGEKALLAFPQKFYTAQHPMLLDLRQTPDVKFLRARWDAARWGRGSDKPMFEFHVAAKEVPADLLAEATAEAAALR
jgi:hypothetical protein